MSCPETGAMGPGSGASITGDATTRSDIGEAPTIPKPLSDFLDLCRARAEQGGIEYGGRSFGRSPTDLADEIVEELADIAVWSGILHARVDRMRETFAAADVEAHVAHHLPAAIGLGDAKGRQRLAGFRGRAGLGQAGQAAIHDRRHARPLEMGPHRIGRVL